MRCPKCGYISFDRQRSCGKCSNDLTAAAEQITGTASKAAAPFFLGAVLGEKNPAYDEPSPILHEEEEPLSLDEEELDFTGVPLSEDDLEDQPLPSLGLEDIDVSDLIPSQEEKEDLELSLGSEQEETRMAQEEEEADSLMDMDLPSLEPDDLFSAEEKESPHGGFAEKTAETPATEEEEEIIDLSSLMNFDDTPAQPPEREEEHDIMDLSLGEAPEELHLSLEDGEHTPAPDDAAKKSATTVADIPDLGLTLENDDQ